MSLPALRDAIDLLTQIPVLWIPGLVCGVLVATLWLVLDRTGMFFASRLLIIFSLAALFFIAGMLAAVKKDGATLSGMLSDGVSYYFRVLVPTLIVAFGILLVFALVVLTLALVGTKPDAGLITFLVIGVVVPTVMLTFFYDTAAVFEEKKVFESLNRSIEVVTANLFEVILFFVGCLLIFATIMFALMVVWTAFLADRLEPITRFNETQLQSFTPDQLATMLGPDGVWITALIIFIGMTVLVPVLYTYKACFYRRIAGSTAPILQVTGEYDTKGRWYKY